VEAFVLEQEVDETIAAAVQLDLVEKVRVMPRLVLRYE
jgi:hypothetical protein